MAKLTLTGITDFRNQSVTANTINNNNAAIELALENTLSRDGTTPNTMSADLDMNANDILNVGDIDASTGTIDTLDGTTATITTVNATTIVLDGVEISATVGADGAPGVGVPAGGTAGQVLSKIDGTDYNTQWTSAAGGVSDGDKGDIVVSGSGAIWTLDSAVVTTAAKTVLDDATVGDMLTTLGGQPLDADLTSWAAITRASGFDTFAATPSSANLRALLTDESGTGAALFAGGDLGTPSAGVGTNLTGIPATALVADTTTALGVGTVELGHASDTTLARVAAGRVSVEGTELQKQPTSDGMVARTAAGTSAARTITGTAPIVVTNGNGVSGNPTISLGTTQLLAKFFPTDNEPPSSNYAVFGTRNGHPYLAFDTTTAYAAIFSDRMPDTYAGGGITVTVFYMAQSATTGTIGWTVEIERMDASSLDLDADSFATAQTITAQTVPGTSGQIMSGSIAISSGANMDSLAAGENYRIRIKRDVANDTATGDAQIVEVHIKET